MKKLVVLSLFACILFSCNKIAQPLQLVGHWQMTESVDDYNSTTGFSQYILTNDNNITASFSADGHIVLTKNGSTLYEGNYAYNEEEKNIAIVEQKNNVLYKFSIVSYTASTLKVAYKTPNGTYIHWFKKI